MFAVFCQEERTVQQQPSPHSVSSLRTVAAATSRNKNISHQICNKKKSQQNIRAGNIAARTVIAWFSKRKLGTASLTIFPYWLDYDLLKSHRHWKRACGFGHLRQSWAECKRISWGEQPRTSRKMDEILLPWYFPSLISRALWNIHYGRPTCSTLNAAVG